MVAVSKARLLNRESKYLKVHLTNGSLYVLHSWQVESPKKIISGMGSHFNANRILIKEAKKEADKFMVPFSDIALIETNQVLKSSNASIAAMTIVSVPVAFMSTICLTDPKACFGSCPTFYVHDGDAFSLQAEGFSSSIARSLEATDIDKLYLAKPHSSELTLQVKNEALETHVIRYADLLIFPASDEKDVFATQDGRFFYTGKIYHPSRCMAPEGDFSKSIQCLDKEERYSLADSTNLSEKEELNIAFHGIERARYGLLVGSRQTLLTTFLLYQSMAFMGNYATFFLQKLESGSQTMRKYANKMYDLLGGIEIYYQKDEGRWEQIEELKEMGPIATDIHLIELPYVDKKDLNIRLKLTKGLWRLDYIALTKLGEEVEPIRLQPNHVRKHSDLDNKALENLTHPENYLVTYPRETYSLTYTLPESNEEYVYFLESRGYYYEWIRKNWLAEENQTLVRMMFFHPKHYLKMMAPAFKKREPFMEEIFWNSRYAH